MESWATLDQNVGYHKEAFTSYVEKPGARLKRVESHMKRADRFRTLVAKEWMPRVNKAPALDPWLPPVAFLPPGAPVAKLPPRAPRGPVPSPVPVPGTRIIGSPMRPAPTVENPASGRAMCVPLPPRPPPPPPPPAPEPADEEEEASGDGVGEGSSVSGAGGPRVSFW